MAEATLVSEVDLDADGGFWFPEWDWSGPVTREQADAISSYGDTGMRLRLLDHPDCTRTALTQMLSCCCPEVVATAAGFAHARPVVTPRHRWWQHRRPHTAHTGKP